MTNSAKKMVFRVKGSHPEVLIGVAVTDLGEGRYKIQQEKRMPSNHELNKDFGTPLEHQASILKESVSWQAQASETIPSKVYEGVLVRTTGITAYKILREKDNSLSVWMKGVCIALESVAETHPSTVGNSYSPLIASNTLGSSVGGKPRQIVAPIPGRVLKVLVALKETVVSEQVVIIMESMKMEMTLPATASGVVQEINCEPGQLVEMGQVLITF